jgi:cullin-4
VILSTLDGYFVHADQWVQALRDAFENFINQREHKPAELIAKYVDARMKEGSKTMTDAQLEADLDKALVLFRYIQVRF